MVAAIIGRDVYDIQSYAGYYSMWLHLLICNSTYHVTFSTSTSLYMGTCYYVGAMYADFTQLLATMNRAAVRPFDPSETHKHAAAIKANLKEAILIHNELHE